MPDGRQVLIIEDDAFLRGLLVEVLNGRGFTTHQADDAATAMNLIDEHDPDALIVDLDLGHGPSGLDVIGAHLTEINVTSPTGFQEITQQTGFDVAACFIDALEVAVMARRSGAAPGFRAG